MTDDLRTRIAAVLAQHECFKGYCTCGNSYGGDTFSGMDEELHRADAVIRELGLKREELGGLRIPGYGHRGHRYVTEWTADE